MGYTHGTSIESKTRICTKCGKEFPNTNEFFSYANKKLGRLNALCKECQKIINKEKLCSGCFQNTAFLLQ